MAPSTEGCTDYRLGCCQACRGAMVNAYTASSEDSKCDFPDDNLIADLGNVVDMFS